MSITATSVIEGDKKLEVSLAIVDECVRSLVSIALSILSVLCYSVLQMWSYKLSRRGTLERCSNVEYKGINTETGCQDYVVRPVLDCVRSIVANDHMCEHTLCCC